MLNRSSSLLRTEYTYHSSIHQKWCRTFLVYTKLFSSKYMTLSALTEILAKNPVAQIFVDQQYRYRLVQTILYIQSNSLRREQNVLFHFSATFIYNPKWQEIPKIAIFSKVVSKNVSGIFKLVLAFPDILIPIDISDHKRCVPPIKALTIVSLLEHNTCFPCLSIVTLEIGISCKGKGLNN